MKNTYAKIDSKISCYFQGDKREETREEIIISNSPSMSFTLN